MNGWLRTLWAEAAKLKRTVALWLALGVPVLTAVLGWLIFSQDRFLEMEPEARWGNVHAFLASLWVRVILPCGSAILIGLLWGLEHSSGHLKHILSLPPSRSSLFAAKLTCTLGLLTLGTLVLSTTLSLALAQIGMTPIRYEVTFAAPMLGLIGSLPAIALVFWISKRCSNFAWPMSLGMVGMIVGMVAFQSERYWKFVPWAWNSLALQGAEPAAQQAILLAVSGGLVILTGAWIHFVKADAPC